MKITWIGHACFKVEGENSTIIFDPYQDGYVPGLTPVREEADAVCCSHEHLDHNARDCVRIKENPNRSFKVVEIDTFHDEVAGAKRGKNTIYIIEMDGKRIAHFGDIGCKLAAEEIEIVKNLDLAMIPIGGVYTIDANEAAELVNLIKPRVTIPMHFRDDSKGYGFDVIDEVIAFAKRMDSVSIMESCSVELSDHCDKVIVLSPKNR